MNEDPPNKHYINSNHMNLTADKHKVHKRLKQSRKYRINKAGESAVLSKHFSKLRRWNEDNVPYQNIPWDVNKEFEVVDVYEIVVMAMFVLPQLIYVYPILFIVILPPVALNLMYIKWVVPVNCDRIPRDAMLWKVHVAVQALLCIPALVIAFSGLLISRAGMIVFGFAYCLVEEDGLSRYLRNLKLIEPYRHGPMLLSYFEDIVSGVAGMVHRRGLLEFTSSFALMFVVNPWIKYWLTGNVYCSELGERFVTQIGSEGKEIDIKQMRRRVKQYISRAKSPVATRRYISSAFFCPHFQYPPSKRFFAIGLEHSTISALVHTTHFRTSMDCLEHSISLSYPTSISPTAELPIYRVILWRNNPYHIYTGVVEANITKGVHCPEHPMWLISGHNKLACDPNVMLSTGWIDTFFEGFLPHISHFINSSDVEE